MSEQTWFAELHDRCYEGLVLTAYAMTNDLGAAEEITQEAFAVAFGRQGGCPAWTARRPGCARSW